MNDRQDASDAEDPENESPGLDDTSESSDDGASGGEGRTESPESVRGGFGVALFALLLALAALGASGWLWWQSRQASQASPLEEIRSQIESLGDRAERLEARVAEIASMSNSVSDSMSDRVAEVESRVERVSALENRLQELAARIESDRSQAGVEASRLQTLSEASDALATRMTDLERSLPEQLAELREALSSNRQQQTVELAERVDVRRRQLALLEVGGLLRLGQSRAELAGDLAGARAAYERASARLESIDGGDLDSIRARLADESEALERVEQPDWARIMSQLQDLDAEAADWPTTAVPPDPVSQPEASESEGWWRGMRRALGGLVQVSERGEAALPESAVESIRERIRLHLAAAQAAAARRAPAELARQMTAVEALLEARFDTGAASVARALGVIDDLEAVQAPALPELGGALAELEGRRAAP